MTARLPTTVRALYRQLPDGRFLFRFSDRPDAFEGAPGEKLDTICERSLRERPELRTMSLPFYSDKSLRAG